MKQIINQLIQKNIVQNREEAIELIFAIGNIPYKVPSKDKSQRPMAKTLKELVQIHLRFHDLGLAS